MSETLGFISDLHPLFSMRVRDGRQMLRKGATRDEVRRQHGTVVLNAIIEELRREKQPCPKTRIDL